MKIIKVNYLTLYFLLLYFLCGYIKIGLIIYFIVIFHELGHILTSLFFKFKIIDITLYPFGGVTRLNKDINTSINKEFILSISGILNQILLFFIIYLLPIENKGIIYKYNLSILLFNLIPIIPMDGSIMLNCLLNKIFSYKKSYYLNILISIIFIIIYLLFNYWYSLNNYLIVSIFIYKVISYLKDFKYIYNKFLLERYLNDYNFKYLSLKKGDLDILKLDTYQYFQENNQIISEKDKLKERYNHKINW